ncbi:MAG: STT3 domain-containing protein [Desulfovibrionaceae bacterium]
MTARQATAKESPSSQAREKISRAFSLPDFSSDWKMLVVFCTIIYLFTLGIRLADLSSWEQPALKVAGEHIMGTHDAYFWLAGAEKIGSAADSAMSIFLDIASRISKVSLTKIAFYAPAVVCSFAALACFFWGRLLGGVGAGIFAALVGGLAQGFYFRTRLGYYDTDIVTLAFPLLVSLGMAFWLTPKLKKTWLQVTNQAIKDSAPGLTWPLLVGIFAGFAGWWHDYIHQFNIIVIGVAVVLTLLLGKKGKKANTLFGVVIFAMAGVCGWYGLLAALLLLLARRLLKERFQQAENNIWVVIALLVLTLLGSGMIGSFYSASKRTFSAYLKPVVQDKNSNESIALPAIAQSVVEAQNVPLSEILNRVTPYAWLSVLGYIGLACVIVIRPVALFLAPLAILSLFGVKMGARFDMFGGPGVALGVAVPLEWSMRWLLDKKPWRKYVIWSVQAAAGLLIMISSYNIYLNLGPTPVLSKPHAFALTQLRELSSPSSQVWTWWDWGYATDFYSRRKSFSDGGKHSGDRIFPLGLALTTPSPLQSSQIIYLTTMLDNNITKEFTGKTPKEAQAIINSLATQKIDFPKIPSPYMVVTWENLRIIHWISFYGSWNFITQSGYHARSIQITQAFEADPRTGTVTIQGQQPIQLQTLDVCSRQGSQHQDYNVPHGPHLVINNDAHDAYLMDDTAYNSMMVQLLIGDYKNPERSRYFHLIWEGYPDVRIYEVLR